MNSNFFEMCNCVFRQNSHLPELKEDVDDYNAAAYYLNNFEKVPREDIENFIIAVRGKSLMIKTGELLFNVASV